MTRLAPDSCQRWDRGRHSFVRTSDGGFNPSRYRVEPIDELTAKTYVTTHHYSRTYPAAARRYGLFHDPDDTRTLVGVAVFGIPAQARVLTGPFPHLEPYRESLELSRFVLHGPAGGSNLAPANAESWFLARTFADLAAHDVHGIVAFSDPVPRIVDGHALLPGHVGIIYQASNAVLAGRSTARSVTVLPDGTTLSDRAIQKVRADEAGADYVARRLVALGARPRHTSDAGATWIRDALTGIGASRIHHPGCYRYLMATTTHDRRLLLTHASDPYPKPNH
ncbi:hypothetical protein [Demequina sp.]|uniref:Mom family adenine methylcarbamoylation protein n=1 Tax=Demequina sp. TaxID=2050685 RepID=UPI003D101C3F